MLVPTPPQLSKRGLATAKTAFKWAFFWVLGCYLQFEVIIACGNILGEAPKMEFVCLFILQAWLVCVWGAQRFGLESLKWRRFLCLIAVVLGMTAAVFISIVSPNALFTVCGMNGLPSIFFGAEYAPVIYGCASFTVIFIILVLICNAARRTSASERGAVFTGAWIYLSFFVDLSVVCAGLIVFFQNW